MSKTITTQQFQDTPELEDWKAGVGGASITFRIDSFTDGADFVREIAAVAEELDHHPDAELRHGSVAVRPTSHDTGGLTSRDLELALRVTALAQTHDFRPEG